MHARYLGTYSTQENEYTQQIIGIMRLMRRILSIRALLKSHRQLPILRDEKIKQAVTFEAFGMFDFLLLASCIYTNLAMPNKYQAQSKIVLILLK